MSNEYFIPDSILVTSTYTVIHMSTSTIIIIIIYFFCANILEDQAQWRDKTKGLIKQSRNHTTMRESSMDGLRC